MVLSEFVSCCIICLIIMGNKKGYGIGFFFKFEFKKEQCIVIIMNKYVFYDVVEFELIFNIYDGSGVIIFGVYKMVLIEDFI